VKVAMRTNHQKEPLYVHFEPPSSERAACENKKQEWEVTTTKNFLENKPPKCTVECEPIYGCP